MILCSCGAQKVIPVSSATTVKVIEHTDMVPVVVDLMIPEIRAEVTTRDTTSFLENEYASSMAIVSRNGELFHGLYIKPQKRPQIVNVPVVHKDSIVYVNTETEKIVEVEKYLSWWQRIRLDSYFILIALIIWAYRKNILKLIRLI